MRETLQIPVSHSGAHSFSARDLAAVLFRHQKLFVFTFLLVIASGFVYSIARKSYTAEMKILIRRGRIDPAVTPTESAPPLLQRDEITEEELNSQVELFRDEDVLREVVQSASLAKRTWISALRREQPQETLARALNRLQKKLEVRAIRKSQVIVVRYTSSDPQVAAAVLKSLAAACLARQSEIQRPGGQEVFFDQQVTLARDALDSAQQQLEAFNRQLGVVSAALERDLLLQKLSDARASELGIEASLAETRRRAQALDALLRHLPPRRVSQIRNADNPQLHEKLRSKLLELQLKRTELLTKFQPSYRLVQELDQQITQAEAAIAGENAVPLHDELTEPNPDYDWAASERAKTGVEIEALQEGAGAAMKQIAEYQQRAQQLAHNTIQQNDLEQKMKAAEGKYLLYVSKREEARMGEALDQSGILNVALVQSPRVPALPNLSLGAALLFSFVSALFLSAAAVFVADYVDASVRTPSEVTALLNVPVLVSLPSGERAKTG